MSDPDIPQPYIITQKAYEYILYTIISQAHMIHHYIYVAFGNSYIYDTNTITSIII